MVHKKSDVYDFCQRIKDENLKFTWGMLAKVSQYNYEDFSLMYETGCRFIGYGVESGSAEMQNQVKEKS